MWRTFLTARPITVINILGLAASRPVSKDADPSFCQEAENGSLFFCRSHRFARWWFWGNEGSKRDYRDHFFRRLEWLQFLKYIPSLTIKCHRNGKNRRNKTRPLCGKRSLKLDLSSRYCSARQGWELKSWAKSTNHEILTVELSQIHESRDHGSLLSWVEHLVQ